MLHFPVARPLPPEVHHINGEGEDAGVVYCEMQGRENSGHERSGPNKNKEFRERILATSSPG